MTKTRKVGDVAVKRFYIVGVFPPGMNAFAVCGFAGLKTSSSDKDGLMPTIGTDKAEALRQFEMARAKGLEINLDGDLVILEFKNGKVTKLKRFEAKGHTSLTA